MIWFPVLSLPDPDCSGSAENPAKSVQRASTLRIWPPLSGSSSSLNVPVLFSLIILVSSFSWKPLPWMSSLIFHPSRPPSQPLACLSFMAAFRVEVPPSFLPYSYCAGLPHFSQESSPSEVWTISLFCQPKSCLAHGENTLSTWGQGKGRGQMEREEGRGRLQWEAGSGGIFPWTFDYGIFQNYSKVVRILCIYEHQSVIHS